MSAGEHPPEPGPPSEPPSDEQAADASSQPRPRIHTGELISAISALLLLPIMFAVEWYGVVGLPGIRRAGLTTAENAWQAMDTVRWLMAITIVVALGSVILHATQRAHGTKTNTSLAVTALGTLSAGLLGYRVLLDPPHPSSVVDVKIGAFLGLLTAIGIALGGYESMREQRTDRRKLVQRSRTRARLASRSQAR